MDIKIGAVGLACPTEVGYDQAENLLVETAKTLERLGVSCFNSGVVMHDLQTVKQAAASLRTQELDILLICIATWSEDHHLLDLLSYIDKPIILRAYPAIDTGSLCCAHQIGAVFTDIGKTYEFVYGEPDDVSCVEKVKSIATAYALKNTMSKVRVGTFGGRVLGMTEISYDEFSIKEKLGSRVVNLDVKELTDKVEQITDADAEKLLEEKKEMLRPCTVLSTHEAMLESMKYYAAMRHFVQEYALETLAVKCYTNYMGKVCLGYSILAEEGVMAACEGDVTNALTMKMLYELSGKPVNNTDLLYLDEKKNTILFSHCGSSGFSIAEGEIELAPVRLMETGVCCKFLMKPGTVTLVNICGHGERFRLSAMTGQAIPCGMEFPGNPMVVQFEKSVETINEQIMEHGIGHHWMIGYGNFLPELKNFCRIQKINYFEL